ncbi:MAG: hypothetical protein ACK4OO_07610 [bacterium]
MSFTTSPPLTLYEGFTLWLFTVTLPSSIASSAWERVRSATWRAKKTSNLSGTLPPGITISISLTIRSWFVVYV